MLIWPWQLRKRGILGMNRRNIRYISRYNPRHLYPLVDNKLKTKLLAQKAGITTPGLIATINSQHDVKRLGEIIADVSGFAIKPAKGSGGKGILVMRRDESGVLVKTSGSTVSMASIERHVSNILAGLYSLGGTPDTVIIEELIEFDPALSDFSFDGVPDIRVIVCRGYPVMAMMRLSTRSSDGKANLHQGAVGVGIDIATGRALKAVQGGEPVTHHPDTGVELASLCIPDWQQLLVLAARCYDETGLGYLGTDMVIDHRYGPMLLELNARPGLSIQVANGFGLLPRLEVIDRLADADVLKPAEQRVALSQQWFCC
ncbi:alpha-L-glutamate ligase-like protein [Thalassolituus marinus]|uniref:Alpha-L-glutamate ligase-like protein n=1 Tax=Thalassolituus marinus TaxID=671053 RepID=A0ABS7ZNF0_9GAMM|nr:alpha-L-glutamate ligase-like protein [Thalassolituus marinus]MCA6063239.1 alpha-L-glutamate ligase-like protein [Thalassolituus marinus]